MRGDSATIFRATSALVLMLIFSDLCFGNTHSSPSERELAAVLQLKADPAHGQQIFDGCAACHGSRATGVSDGTVPAIAGQHLRVIIWELSEFRHGQRMDPRMQHFTDDQHLTGGAQDLADVAAYVSRLRPNAPAAILPADGTARGGLLYRSHCASCHGPKAQGDDQQRNPRLAGQHFEYLLQRLQGGIENQRTNTSAQHGKLRLRLMPANLRAICDYPSQIGP